MEALVSSSKLSDDTEALKFPIPLEFQSQLRFIDSCDHRSDEEILASLAVYEAVTSEKNIWAFWHSGAATMPGWCQRNVINWARLCGPSWTIRILDAVADSPNHFLKYLSPDVLPETLIEGTMTGPYIGQHSADFLRGACLHEYGGVFMDVGIILFRSLDRICWRELEDPESPYQICVSRIYGPFMGNWFVAARKGDPFIKAWHDIFMHLWEDRVNYEGIGKERLIAWCQLIDFSEARNHGFNVEFNVEPDKVVEYVAQIIVWVRLCMINGGAKIGELNWSRYAKDRVLWFDAVAEVFGAESVVDFRGQKVFDALTTRMDADEESEEYRLAYQAIWRMLTKSSMQKVMHGKGHTETPALGVLLDLPENEGRDREPGTFAELLRYGSVHFEQTREMEYADYQRPADIWDKGIFES
ncbi:hypothetical protein TWF696_002906 [Orbilia brochopaga]|uniref:Capsule polysaccharide biosynthesis protein n=1 Tax=Orbilia brochopaga TaxID=3140254 RepID=A0AAV9U0S1_9PEZI